MLVEPHCPKPGEDFGHPHGVSVVAPKGEELDQDESRQYEPVSGFALLQVVGTIVTDDRELRATRDRSADE
jgi:hypothetical protein